MSFDHKRFRDEGSQLPDESLRRLQSNRSNAAAFLVIISVGAVIWLIISIAKATHKDPTDVAMLQQAEHINRAIKRFHLDTGEYPDNLDMVVQYFPADGKWPIEPYSGQAIHDTGSKEFTGQESIGMVHYMKIELETKTGYRLYVFGREAVLKVMWGGYVIER